MLKTAASLVVALNVSCMPPQQPVDDSLPPGTIVTADSVRGTLRIVGSDPATYLTVTPGSGSAVRLTGPAAAAMRSVSNADVVVRGRQVGNVLDVISFAVRSVDGRPVWDGVLSHAGTGMTLSLSEGGTITLQNPPAALHGYVNRRVWITQPGGGNAAYGVIAAP